MDGCLLSDPMWLHLERFSEMPSFTRLMIMAASPPPGGVGVGGSVSSVIRAWQRPATSGESTKPSPICLAYQVATDIAASLARRWHEGEMALLLDFLASCSLIEMCPQRVTAET